MSDFAMPLPLEALREFGARHPVRRLAVFGSVLRDDFSPTSDVDVLVEFEPDAKIGFIKLYDLEQALSALVGRHVDLRTPQELSRFFRDDVLQRAVVVYESA